MRNLLDARCERCQAAYYSDLPSGHALFCPTAVDKETRQVFDPAGAAWFSKLLVDSIQDKSVDHVTISFRRARRHRTIVLVNCLDYLYGHCLLKLLNAQYYLDRFPLVATCVMVPKQLTHLVPDGVAEVWEVDLPLKGLKRWYVSVQKQVHEEIEARETCYLSVAHSHPHPSRYDLRRFIRLRDREDVERDGPVIVFAYREDRLWGVSLQQQAGNIAALYETLKLAFPGVNFTVTGFGTRVRLAPGIVDERATQFSSDQEPRLLDLYAAADCVIGVHGSNMLLASGLAKHVVELMPEDRLGNFTQDLLWPSSSIADNDALYRVRFMYGSSDLQDVKPQLVGKVVVHQLGFWPLFTSLTTSSLLPGDAATGVFDTVDLVNRVPAQMAAYVHLKKTFTDRQMRRLSHRLAFRFKQLTRYVRRKYADHALLLSKKNVL